MLLCYIFLTRQVWCFKSSTSLKPHPWNLHKYNTILMPSNDPFQCVMYRCRGWQHGLDRCRHTCCWSSWSCQSFFQLCLYCWMKRFHYWTCEIPAWRMDRDLNTYDTSWYYKLWAIWIDRYMCAHYHNKCYQSKSTKHLTYLQFPSIHQVTMSWSHGSTQHWA